MRILSSLLLFVFFTLSLNAQVLDPVKWSTSYEHVEGNEYNLIFTAKIEDGWTIYSQYLENDDGPVRTSFNFDPGAFEMIGKTKEEGKKKEGYDKLFDMNVIKFSKNATFTQRVKVDDLSKPIVGYLEYMTCDDSKCLPPTEVDFNFQLEAPKDEPKLAESTASEKSDKGSQIEQEEALVPAIAEETPALVEEEAVNTAPQSGILEPVKWSFSKKELGGNEYELTFTANLDKNWNLYSQHTSDDGPIPTTFYFTEGEHFELLGETTEEGKKKEGKDPLFDNVVVIKYLEGPVVFTQKVKVNDDTKPIEGFIEYMSCDASKCIALEEDFSFALSESAIANVPTIIPVDGNVLDQSRPTIQETYQAPVGNCGEEDVAKGSLFWTFLLGFVGGLFAILTPCVFPMIPLTVSFFTKSSKDRASGIKNALIYGLSIIVIYVAIGLIITGVFGATALNELSTNWIANTLFFIIFVFFAFSFFGYYEITLPSSWANKSDSMADQGGLIGTFFMAFTLALVSFSCTGPIIGSAIVQSATDKLGPFVVMLGFSSALALPFGLFAAFPAWLNSLPKSGGWMNTVKVFLGFLELALAFKFLSVADMTMHWGILPYEIFMGAVTLTFLGLTLYLFGFIRFPHDGPKKKLSVGRWAVALSTLALTLYLGSGLMIDKNTNSYNSLGLLSGLAPPAYYNIFLPDSEVNPEIKSKYPSFTKCANNLDCFKDYYEGLAYAQEVNKPVLLDFTGYGCVNCRKTEEHIWVVDDVRRKLDEDFVLVSLYVDDRKPLDETLISKSRQTKLRNIGHKWADFQIINFQQNSQPLYVMMTPDERVLAAPRGYKEGADDYAEFLECGLTTFKRTSSK